MSDVIKNKRNGLKIYVKVYMLAGIFAVGFFVYSLISFSTLTRLKVNGEIYSRIVSEKDLIADILPPPEYIIESYLTAHELLNTTDKKQIEALIDKSKQLKLDYETRHDYWEKTLEKGNLKTTFTDESYQPAIEFFNLLINNYIPAVRNGESETARQLLTHEMKDAYEKHRAAIDKVVTMATAQNVTEEANARSQIKNRTSFLIAFIFIILIITFIIAIIISSNIKTVILQLLSQTRKLIDATLAGKLNTRANPEETNFEFREITRSINDILDAVIGPLNVAAEYVAKISVGDMPPVITEKYNGDFNNIKNNLNILINALNEIIIKAKLVADGDLIVDLKLRSGNDELMQSLTEMVKSTAKIISEFQTAANNISSSSEQMSSTSQQMSHGASEQASSAEEASSSMEQMAANIQQNTENAHQTEKIALNAAEGINKVNDASEQTLKYMQEIADKVSIIGEIARQTNILALNAAVEAARAGEHGKGFAVVAAEVRKLAERSQASAVEIDSLTKNSVKATKESVTFLAAIAPDISKTAKLVQEIAAASNEQNSGADQVNSAIQQLNQITQQNAAASEELATSSEELAGQAQQLMEMISFFKLESNSTGKKALS
jgi:methyl-accepting chemotaxis protein